MRYFSRFGEVLDVVVRSGFGFVNLKDEASLKSVLEMGENSPHIVCGRRIDVKRAKKDGRGSEPPLPKRCNGRYDPYRIFVGTITTTNTLSFLHFRSLLC